MACFQEGGDAAHALAALMREAGRVMVESSISGPALHPSFHRCVRQRVGRYHPDDERA